MEKGKKYDTLTIRAEKEKMDKFLQYCVICGMTPNEFMRAVIDMQAALYDKDIATGKVTEYERQWAEKVVSDPAKRRFFE